MDLTALIHSVFSEAFACASANSLDITTLGGRFFGSYDVTIIMVALIVKKCLSRGRPQGGRAVFIVSLLVVVILLLTGVAITSILDTLSEISKIWH